MKFRRIANIINRGDERTSLAKKNIAWLFFIKIASALSSFLLVSITIDFLNPVQYGIWITLSSIISWMSFLDIGIGNGLKNKFPEAIALNNIDLAKKLVSTIYLSLICLSLVLLLLFFVLLPHINWIGLLNAPVELKHELSLVAGVVVVSFLIQFVLQVIKTLLDAVQKPAYSSLIDAVSQVIVLFIVFFLSFGENQSLLMLAIVICTVQILTLSISTIIAFSGLLNKFKPSFRDVDFSLVRPLLSVGIKFFIIQIAAILCYQTNNVIIVQILGPSEVTVYNVIYKYFSILTIAFSIVVTPFWVAFTDAYTKNDYIWMEAMVKKLRKVWLLLCVIAVLLVVCYPFVFDLWLPDSITIAFSQVLGMAVFQIVYIWTGVHSQIINGIGKIQIQLILAIISMILNVPMSILMGKYFGLNGIIISQIIIALLLSAWLIPIQVDKIVSKKDYGFWGR